MSEKPKYNPNEEQREEKYWSQGVEETPETKLNEKTAAELARGLKTLADKVYDDPEATGLVALDAATTETLDAMSAAFGEGLDETKLRAPEFSRTYLEDGYVRYSLQILYEDGLDDKTVVFESDESSGKVVKRRDTEPETVVAQLEDADISGNIDALKGYQEMLEAGVGTLLREREGLHPSVEEAVTKEGELQGTLDDINQRAKEAWRAMFADDNPESTQEIAVLAMQKAKIEDDLAEQKIRVMRAATAMARAEGDEGLTNFTSAYIEAERQIQNIEARHRQVTRELGESVDVTYTEEVATDENGIAEEFNRLVKALNAQPSQE